MTAWEEQMGMVRGTPETPKARQSRRTRYCADFRIEDMEDPATPPPLDFEVDLRLPPWLTGHRLWE